MMMDVQEFIYLYPGLSYIFLGVISLLVGSFLNVVIYRLPRMLENELKTQVNSILNQKIILDIEPLSLSLPRSKCTKCLHQISWWQNIPIFSYLFLKGKCGYCKHKISYIYPLVEILCLVLSMFAGYIFGINLTLLFVLLFTWIIICLSFIDFKHQILPDNLNYSLLWLGLLANSMHLFTSLPYAVYGALVGYLGLWIFVKIFYLFTGKIGMGNGDFKLFAALGAWSGWQALGYIIFIASVLGTIIGLIYLNILKKSKDTPIPFGPYLCVAGYVYLLAQNIF